jgi:hypothetical protein
LYFYAAIGSDVNALLLYIRSDMLLDVVSTGAQVEVLEVVGESGVRAVDVNLRVADRALDLHLT